MALLTLSAPSIDGAMDSPKMPKMSLSLASFLMFLISYSLMLGFSFSAKRLLTPVATSTLLKSPDIPR